LADWIEYPPEPKELLLVWQAPSFVPDRLRWAVGRLRRTDLRPVFEYLQGADFAKLNHGRSQADLRAASYSGYPAFDESKQPEGGFQERVLEAFLRRVPPSTRSDFPDYLAHHQVPRMVDLSPFALLAVTEARLPSDGFSLVDPLDPSVSHADVVLEIAGFSHFQGLKAVLIAVGDPLDLIPEPSNQKDPNAVQVRAADDVIGYVNHLQAETISKWLTSRNVLCRVVRLNGKPDAPRAYAFLQVRPADVSIAA
jgi:hypothetical protein